MNTLPRSYGNGGPTVRNPATLLPALARKPNAWGESPLRGELPDGLAAHLDALDPRCVCSIESGPCERVESLQMSGRF